MTGGARYPPRLSREVSLVYLVYLVCGEEGEKSETSGGAGKELLLFGNA